MKQNSATFHNWKNKWKEIPIERQNDDLATINGFNTTNNKEAINLYKSTLAMQIHQYVSNGKQYDDCDYNILEVGCGNSENLLNIRTAIEDQNSDCNFKYFGCDYSDSMIEMAKKEFPEAEFAVAEAAKLPWKDSKFDFVFVHSVFQYFPSEEYAMQVLKEIYRVANDDKRILILDVPNVNMYEKYLALRGPSSKGYEHAFYDPNTFINFFSTTDIRNRIIVEYAYTKIYDNSLYRFNVLINP